MDPRGIRQQISRRRRYGRLRKLERLNVKGTAASAVLTLDYPDMYSPTTWGRKETDRKDMLSELATRHMDSCVNAIGCLVPTYTGGNGGSTDVDNAQLIRAAQQGDGTAFEQLVRQYDRAVLRVAVHLTGSTEDGQDIYQEAFLRAYIKLSRFRFECSFYTWIYRIVTNLCLDHLRKRRLHHRYSTSVSSQDGQELDVSDQVPDERAIASPERTFAVRVLREHIARALDTLSPRERMVFELKHYQGMQLKTVAGILNTTEGTAKNTLFRATRKLRTILAGVR